MPIARHVALPAADGGRYERDGSSSGSSHRASLRVDKRIAFMQARYGSALNLAHDCPGTGEGNIMSPAVTSKRLVALRSVLTERDWQIISTLSRVRVATGAQLRAMHFADVTRRRTQQRLASLVRSRVLARLPRVIGGVRAGSAGQVYALDVAGQRLVDLDTGRRPGRPRNVGEAFLAHALAVTEILAGLTVAERAGQLHVVQFVGEPEAWRSFHGPGGGRAILKPDAFAVLAVGSFEDHWFLEVDLGTEAPSTLQRKCTTYRSYWLSGTEQARHEVFPRVLWLVPGGRRADLLADVIARLPADASSLFAVSLHAEAVARMRAGAGP
jgi:hypothetical protein